MKASFRSLIETNTISQSWGMEGTTVSLQRQ